MAHGDAREGKWRGNWRMEWVASTLHITSERGVSNITTADAHTSAASSLLNWRPCRYKWTRPFRRKTKSGFCACVITFQTKSDLFLMFRCTTFGGACKWRFLTKFCIVAMFVIVNLRSVFCMQCEHFYTFMKNFLVINYWYGDPAGPWICNNVIHCSDPSNVEQ
jgi:hypothetical protein